MNKKENRKKNIEKFTSIVATTYLLEPFADVLPNRHS